MAGKGSSVKSPVLKILLEGSKTSLDVKQVTIHDHESLIDQAIIVFDDPHRIYTEHAKEGQTVKVQLGWSKESSFIFEGIITGVDGYSTNAKKKGSTESKKEAGTVTKKKTDTTGRSVTLKALDLSYRMKKSIPKKTIDHTGKLSTIIKKIVAEHKIPIGQISLDKDPEFTKKKPLRQGLVNDWAFIQVMASKYGAMSCVEYNEKKSQFYFISQSQLMKGERKGTLRLCHGVGHLIEFEYQRVAGTAAAKRRVALINRRTGKTVASPPTKPDKPETPTKPDPAHQDSLDKKGGVGKRNKEAVKLAAAAKQTPAEQRPEKTVTGIPADPDLTEQVTHRNPTRVLGMNGKGKAIGTVKLRAKSKIELLGIAAWADGDWYVKEVIHKANRAANTYTSQFVVTR